MGNPYCQVVCTSRFVGLIKVLGIAFVSLRIQVRCRSVNLEENARCSCLSCHPLHIAF